MEIPLQIEPTMRSDKEYWRTIFEWMEKRKTIFFPMKRIEKVDVAAVFGRIQRFRNSGEKDEMKR